MQSDRIRQSWQPRRLSGTPAKAWLIARRLAATLIAVALIGFLGWRLMALFLVPRTYFAYLSASTYQPLGGQPVDYAAGDFRTAAELAPAFARSSILNPAERQLTADVLMSELRAIADWNARSGDKLIIYLTAHGVVRNGEAHLLLESDSNDRTEATISAADVLEQLERLSAGTKLLILDAGRDHYNPRFGTPINTFPELLEQAVLSSADDSLWVLCANAPLERSNTSASQGRSIFASVLSEGMRGKADADGDQNIQLEELYAYVQARVAAWATEALRETQTPLLFHCDPAMLDAEQLAGCDLLSTKAFPAEASGDADNDAVAGNSVVDLIAERAEEFVPDAVKQGAESLGSGSKSESSGEGGDGKAEDQNGGSKGNGNGKQPGKATDYGGRAKALLDEGWRLADEFEASAAARNPVAAAPADWRETLDQLLWYDYLGKVGLPADDGDFWAPVIAALGELNKRLAWYCREDGARIGENARYEQLQFSSLAMVPYLRANPADQPQKEGIDAFAAEWRALLDGPNGELSKKLDEIISAKEGKGESPSYEQLKRFYEFQLIEPLRNDSELLALVARTRGIGECTAANILCGQGWAQATVTRADRLRLEAERMIVDQTSSNWRESAKEALAEAETQYKLAAAELATLDRIVQQRNQLLRRAPEYVRWAHLSTSSADDEASAVDVIAQMFALLGQLNEALAEPSRDNFRFLEDKADELAELKETLEEAVSSTRDPSRIADYLATTLPPAALRDGLLRERAREERKLMASLTVGSNPIARRLPKFTDQRRSQLRDQFELEFALARLAGCDEASFAELEKLVDGSKAGLDGFVKANERLAELYAKSLAAAKANFDAADLQDVNERADRLAQLRKAACQMVLQRADRREIADLKTNLVTAVKNAASYDLLRWQHERFRNALVDAPNVEAEALRNTAEFYRKLANGIDGQPEIDAVGEPRLVVESPSEVYLATKDQDEVIVTVRSNFSAETPLWLVAQYNGDWLEVSGPGIVRQHELKNKQGASGEAAAFEYPIGPTELGSATPEQLPARGTREFRLTVRRQSSVNEGGKTKLILKAIAGDTPVAQMRKEVAVTLPGKELLVITAEAERMDYTDHSPGQVTLYPLPNHVHDFAFYVANRAELPKKLNVEFWIPSVVPTTPVPLPLGAQTEQAALDVLRPFATRSLPLRRLGRSFPIELPATGESVRVTLPLAEDIKPGSNLLIGEQTDPKAFEPLVLRHGLLVLLRDLESNEITIRRIQIQPQRPWKYLKAAARFDQSTRRFEIKVQAIDPVAVPTDGIRFKADIVGGVSAQESSDLSGELTPTKSFDTVYAHIPGNPQDVTAYVEVDGYPRAFQFRVPVDSAADETPPVKNVAALRISAEKKLYNSSARSIPVRLQVDAPEGEFDGENANAVVEVGIDDERNRELQGDSMVKLPSDRQVEISAVSMLPDGSLALKTTVGDWNINLPTGGQNNVRAYLLGRLVIDRRVEARSDDREEPFEIVLDGTGPEIYVHDIVPDLVEAGKEFEVHVRDHSERPDWSGIKSVKVVVETIADGESKDVKWEDAAESGGEWVAKLKADEKWGTGKRTLLIRAEDRVGNVTTLRSPEVVEIIRGQPATPAVVAAAPADITNTVTGQVIYRGQAVAANVELLSPAGAPIARATADAKGAFTFARVPPGAYKLKAESLEPFQNYIRRTPDGKEPEVTVPPRPQKPPTVRVSLQ